jgi:molybdopterin synthase sulfur carrier subunit
MAIQVRYFASLRERLGRPDEVVDAASIATVADLWVCVSGGLPWPPNTLVAVNLEYRDAAHPLREGDEVAFFPPVTGG